MTQLRSHRLRSHRLGRWRAIAVGSALAVAAIGGVASPAHALSFGYVNTLNPIPANTTYFDSTLLTHTGHQIANCQNPTFSAGIYLSTSGGSQIRSKVGNCPLFNTGHTPEASTRANCTNKETTAKFAACTEFFN